METIVEMVAEVFGVDQGTGYNVVLATVISVTLTFFIVTILRAMGVLGGGGKKQRAVFLLGSSDSGKTLLFSLLAAKRTVDTYTSMKENVVDGVTFLDGGRKFRLVDVPGANRIRRNIFDQYLKTSQPAALIYIIDSSTIQSDCRETAEYLYEILSHPAIVKSKQLPILIVCNKQDSSFAKGAQLIRKTLEKELSLLNKTRAASLDSTSGSDDRNLLIGKDGSHEFRFDQLSQGVEFVEATLKDAEDPFPIFDWLTQL